MDAYVIRSSGQPKPIVPTHAPSRPNPNMKEIDVSNMDIVFRGIDWEHDEDPGSKKMASKLERNEALVTWFQPRDGSVEDQIPAIKVGDRYQGLSLRMQKSIWRHVRLKKGFINLESLSQGGYKLKIPKTLLSEKEKTRTRFAQMRRKDSKPQKKREASHDENENEDDGDEGEEGDDMDMDLERDLADVIEEEMDREDDASESAEASKPKPSAEGSKPKNKPKDEDAKPSAEGSKEMNSAEVSKPKSKKKAEDGQDDAESKDGKGSAHPRRRTPLGRKKTIRPSAGATAKDAGAHAAAAAAGAGATAAMVAKLPLARRIQHSLMHVIVPIGKQRMLAVGHVKDPSSQKPATQLPRVMSFVMSEENALRKIVARMVKECPRTCRMENKEEMLVAILKCMHEVVGAPKQG